MCLCVLPASYWQCGLNHTMSSALISHCVCVCVSAGHVCIVQVALDVQHKCMCVCVPASLMNWLIDF